MFGKKLKQLIEQKSITAYQLHKDTGIPKATIHQWLHGGCNPSIGKLLILAKYFEISLDELIGGDSQ